MGNFGVAGPPAIIAKVATTAEILSRAARETSAQVGRVAARLRISAVVATLAIIAGASGDPEVTHGLLPCENHDPGLDDS